MWFRDGTTINTGITVRDLSFIAQKPIIKHELFALHGKMWRKKYFTSRNKKGDKTIFPHQRERHPRQR